MHLIHGVKWNWVPVYIYIYIYSLFRINWPVADGLLLVLHDSVEKIYSVHVCESILIQFDSQTANKPRPVQKLTKLTMVLQLFLTVEAEDIVQSQRGTYTYN